MGARKAPGWWSGITTADLDSDGDWMSSPATGALQLLYRLLKSILSASLRYLAGRGVVDLVEASMTLPKDNAPAQIGRSGTCLRSSAPSSRRTKLSEGPRERLGFDPARPELGASGHLASMVFFTGAVALDRWNSYGGRVLRGIRREALTSMATGKRTFS